MAGDDQRSSEPYLSAGHAAGDGRNGAAQQSAHDAERHKRMRTRREIRFADVTFLFVLACFILVMATLGIAAPDRSFSDEENRNMATWPELSLTSLQDGTFASGVQSYISDQFFGRDSWTSLRLNVEKAEGAEESNGVYLGKDGYLIEQPAVLDEDRVGRSVASINAFASSHPNLNVRMAVIPNAVCVMSDRLPDNAPVHDQRTDLAWISSSLADQVDFIDVTDALCSHSSEPLYYRTDHHWTSLGASYAFQAIAPELGIDDPIDDYDVYTVADGFEGTMASKCGSHAVKDTVQVYVPQDTGSVYYVTNESTHQKSSSLYSSEALVNKDKYTVFFGGNYPQITINTSNANGRCLLIFKDSYANCFVQFLTPYFQKIVMVDPRYYYDNVSTVINNQGVTDVLFLYNLNTFLGDTSLCDTLDTANASVSSTATAPVDAS